MADVEFPRRPLLQRVLERRPIPMIINRRKPTAYVASNLKRPTPAQ
jgi:hypothetical protein